MFIVRRNYTIVILIAVRLIQLYKSRIEASIRSIYTKRFAGERKLRNLIAQPLRIQRFTRFIPTQFNKLYSIINIKDSYEISSKQKLLCFLYIVAQNRSYRDVAETFNYPISTIYAIFYAVLLQLVQLYRVVVRLTVIEDADIVREKGGKYQPYFEYTVGALDSSYINAQAKIKDVYRYRNRKGYLSQNVLAIVDYKRLFTFVLPRQEGSAYNRRILYNAVDYYSFRAPDRIYYLADARYSNSRLTLTLYRGVRYYLREVQIAGLKLENTKELYNLRHSLLRNVVERIFGIFKRRFQIFKAALEFLYLIQTRLVYAYIALYNFLTVRGTIKPILVLERDSDNYFQQRGVAPAYTAIVSFNSLQTDIDIFRDKLAERIQKDYVDNYRKEEADKAIPTDYKYEFRLQGNREEVDVFDAG